MKTNWRNRARVVALSVALTLVAGWWLIFIGIMEIISAFQVKSGAKDVPREL